MGSAARKPKIVRTMAVSNRALQRAFLGRPYSLRAGLAPPRQEAPMAKKSGKKPGTHHLDAHAGAIAERAAGDPDELIDSAALARLLGVSNQWVEKARRDGTGPAHLHITSKLVRYRRGD